MFSYQIAFYINYIILIQMSQSNQQGPKPSIPVSKVVASLKAGDTTYDLTAVRYVNKINQWPTISAEILLKPSGSNKTEVVVDGSLIQELYKIKNSQDEVSVTFGIENETTTVTCIIRSAYIIVSQSDIAMNLVLTPSYTKVDNLNLSILRLVDGLFDIDSNLIDSPHIDTKHMLMQYVIESLNKLMARWKRCRQNIINKSSKIEKKVIKDIDDQNQKVIDIFKTLLTNSIDSVGDLYDIGSNFFYKDPNLYQEIIKCLTTNNGSFISNICGLANLFKLVYVPGHADDIGKFIPRSDLMPSEEEGKEAKKSDDITVVSAEVNLGGLGLLPLGYVYTEADALKDLDGSRRNVIIPVYGCFPEDIESITNKSSSKIAAPTWRPIYSEYQETNNNGPGDPSNGASGNRTVTSPSLDATRSNISKILQEWCRQEFCYQVSTTNYAEAVLFYKASPSIFGSRAIITDNKETNANTMFEGFVSSYEQLVSKQGLSEGEIYTSVTLIGVQ